MQDLQTLSQNGQTIWCEANLAPQITQEWFSAEFWRQRGELTGSATGRGTTYFIRYQQQEWVLRHYKRGGLIGRVLNDQYCYVGLKHTRVFQELTLLSLMRANNLPVPRPIAGRVLKGPGFYRADLICEKIPQAKDLHQILLEQPLPEEIWIDIGKTIARFHQQQIFHHDLNIHNIMLDNTQRIWLIDFDKCAIKPGEQWKSANLARLQRSLEKELRQHQTYHYQPANMDSLLQGYSLK